ncbi:MAG: hypothetical protein ACYC96_12440 [Fimbriimonadaceae bacterium]
MNRFQAAIIVYGLIMMGMGLQAYFFPSAKASPASVIAGSAIGILEIFFAALSKTHQRVGYIGAAVVALLTLGRWIPHLFKDGQIVIYPALIGTVLSVGLALYLVGGHLATKRRSRKAQAEPPAA